MPIDIYWLRAERGGDPEKWREHTRKRFKPVSLVDNVIELDEKWRKAQFEADQARKAVGIVQKEIGTKMKAKEDASAEKAKKEELEKEVARLDAVAKELELARDKALDLIPNEVDPEVPISNDEKDNKVLRVHGEKRPSTPELLHHHELLYMIDGYEPERGVAVAGHRAYFLKGVGMLLNQALINYGIQFLDARGYTPLQPPFFMNKECMAGVAQLSDFDEQLYKVIGEDEKYLIATSEQPICVYHKDEWLQEKDLPKRYAGYSTCFRKEAGSHGKDAWGIFRIHQFEKVEQFVVCEPEESQKLHEEMIAAAEEFYKNLGLAYHVVCIVSGELNNAAAKKYDLEAWFPTLGVYRELVSASNCTDYQARAMEVRCGAVKKVESTKKYCHFLNSTLCATERTICAILENYQTPEGVRVPDVLVPFMAGRTFLPFVREKPTTGSTATKAPAKAAGGAGAEAKTGAPAHAPAPKAAPAPAPAAAPAVAVPSVPATLSAGVLGIVGKPALTSPQGIAALNGALAVRSYVAGYTPSAEDDVIFTALTAAGHSEGSALLKGAPHALRWFKHVKSFPAGERATWPLTQAQLLSGAVNARQTTLFTL